MKQVIISNNLMLIVDSCSLYRNTRNNTYQITNKDDPNKFYAEVGIISSLLIRLSMSEAKELAGKMKIPFKIF